MSFFKNIFGKKDEEIKTSEDFWIWFQKNSDVFFRVVKNGNVEKDFFNHLSPKLGQLRDGLFFLAGMADSHTAELIVTPDGTIKNILFVEEFVASAPAIKGWKFTALKPALDLSDVGIEMSGYKFGTENMNFYSNESPYYPDEIDITVVHDDCNDGNKKAITAGVFIFMDNFLGELNFATTIDSLEVIGRNEIKKELIPMAKLKAFLVWREKEFIEKYEGTRYGTENDTYSVFEARQQNGNKIFAALNTDLLEWDSKASHPWIVNVEIKYDGKNSNGMPNAETFQLLDEIEDKISARLKDSEGYLNVGRRTADSTRDIYFACKEFRKPSKILPEIVDQYSSKLDINYDIYKDKYWRTFNQYRKK